MQMIEIVALSNGAHRNQTTFGDSVSVPDGWAVIPEGMELECFPFGGVEVTEVDGIMTVTKWTPGDVLETEEIKKEPSQLDIIEAQVTYTAMMTGTLLEA